MTGRSTGALAAVLSCAVLALGACGGDDDSDEGADAAPARAPAETTTEVSGLGDEEQATAVLRSFFDAIVADDAAAACGLLNAHGVRLVEEGALLGSPSGGGDCAEVVLETYDGIDAAAIDGFRVVQTERPEPGTLRISWVNDDTPITGAVAARLVNEGDGWKLESTGIPGQG